MRFGCGEESDRQTTLQTMQGSNVSLNKAFQQSRNLGDLASAWIKALNADVKAKGISTKAKFTIGDSASLLAPAALVAKVLTASGIETEGRTLRVLVLGEDAIARMDRCMWAPYAGNFLGNETTVKIYQTKDELPESPWHSVGESLGLSISELVSHDSIQAGTHVDFDIAIWIHPANEVDLYDHQSLATAHALTTRDIPVFACTFSEQDLHLQNYMLSRSALRLKLLSEPLVRGSPTINTFGISVQTVGVTGGWGAILCRLEPTSQSLPKEDVSAVHAAAAMMRMEGAGHGSWNFGSRINGVAFNKIIPTGLLGNMAIDDKTGYVLTENDKPRIINVIGHLWTDQLTRMPKTSFELMAWASRLKLSFLSALPREGKKRDEAIAVLSQAYEDGVLEAAVGLARAYEASSSNEDHALAHKLYREIGDRHPMSAYATGHLFVESGDMQSAMSCFECAAAFGYPPAVTDLGIAQCQTGNVGKGMGIIKKAAAMGDAKANFIIAEQLIEEGMYSESLASLRAAWSIGHLEALNTAHFLTKAMMDKNLGKRTELKQEIRDIESFLKKRGRLETEARAANE